MAVTRIFLEFKIFFRELCSNAAAQSYRLKLVFIDVLH